MKKKLLAILLSSAMVVSLAACGSSSDSGSADTSAPAAETSDSTATTDAAADTASSDTAAAETTESTDAAASDYELTDLYITVDGTLTANVDSGQDAFIAQWEEAVSEKIGHPIKLHINQPEHSGYKDNVSQLLTTGTPGDGQYPDALIMSATMFKQYQQTGILWNMADAYANAEFQSRVTLPLINQNMMTPDGELYGFAAGMLASNHDISDLFIDSALKICGNDTASFDRFLDKLALLVEELGVHCLITASIAVEEATETMKKYI